MTTDNSTPVILPLQPNAAWEHARSAAFSAGRPLPYETVPLAEALGQILALDATALQPVPHYASSAMDGWAVSGPPPWQLVTHEEPPTERWQIHKESGRRPLQPGQAVAILTGGTIPAGAHSVLRSESGVVSEDGMLTLSPGARSGEPGEGEHIRPAGEEAAAGEVTIRRGTVLNPAHIALAAVCGHDTLPVLRAPRVSLLLTGDEVIEYGLPESGQVRDTFGPQLPQLVTMMGGRMDVVRRLSDRYEDVVAALSSDATDEMSIAMSSGDVLITTGGTGRSEADHLRQALEDMQAEMLIDGIAMRPGHPTMLARLPDGRLLVALPGNPLAAMMAVFTVLQPLLDGLRGAPLSPERHVLVGVDIEPLPGRTRLIPCRIENGRAVPSPYFRSGMLRGIADADAVMVVPEAGCTTDEAITALPLPWAVQQPPAR
ncbi:molybdopterin molybdotransferase MoeA [Arthrobacter gengyunqii]|uniref:Molybdopterin molybdenumtransferase n=1 Tax=Arthrobacter gengyunqii TaxID=2886940 RepID=A0A9X1S7V8_9MICC|nr:molybdopterin molybdotransferase MoeA [Arthrobacter gengyunqii]MCC3267674.1 molybdopterin molybdotransferase MoeA [Arthrobacter gengyunqii]MCC3270702.1 molybdopterin molybdotransferase MoeA [Arthrobacter gengyunqii]UOY96684.1 molybdopterin molybdotransferase MoeA [Arthrobacter gengyunqii]